MIRGILTGLLGLTVSIALANTVPPDVQVLRDLARPLESPRDLDPLIKRIGDARLVLLGEASHGTSEYYTWRAAISRRLIEEQGFRIVAVEGDWATLYRLNRYVKWLDTESSSARDIMLTFNRWPVWMWANEETAELIEWMRTFNQDRPFADRVGFYGIDVYGNNVARQELLKNASVFGDDLAAEVAELLACIAPYADHMHNYARAVAAGAASCADSFEQLYERLRVMWEDVDASNRYDFLALKMNAKVVKNAERHFRLMVEQGPASWNARVDHFYNVVAHLLEYHGPPSRAVVWAHNTHIGDARFTSMGAGGQRNIGQIARERHQADDVVAVGFGTYRGTVQAGRAWGAPMETMQVPDGRPDSVEALMLQVEMPSALFIFTEAENLSPLMEVRGHRAIGVVYQPDRERLGNYVPTILPRRYDAFIFFEETRALTPVQ